MRGELTKHFEELLRCSSMDGEVTADRGSGHSALFLCGGLGEKERNTANTFSVFSEAKLARILLNLILICRVVFRVKPQMGVP